MLYVFATCMKGQELDFGAMTQTNNINRHKVIDAHLGPKPRKSMVPKFGASAMQNRIRKLPALEPIIDSFSDEGH